MQHKKVAPIKSGIFLPPIVPSVVPAVNESESVSTNEILDKSTLLDGVASTVSE